MHRSWRLRRRPGARMPEVDDFELRSEPLSLRPAEGEVLLRNRYLSLDPYMRWRMNDAKSYAPPVGLGEVMVGSTVAEVLESRHPDFAAGDHVVAPGGWQSHACVGAGRLRRIEAGALPLTVFLGALGSPGFTAWAGLRHIGKPQAGETVVVGAATGPVGALVGQIARAAAVTLLVQEAPAVQVADGEMGHINLARAPFGVGAALTGADGAAENGELEAEAAAIVILPTRVEPVKDTMSTSGCEESGAPTPGPSPFTRLNTPAGTPASCRISAKM